MGMKIPLLSPEIPEADAILPYLRRIDAARWYTNFGPLVRELEARLAGELGARAGPLGVTTLCNATVGLELALLALDLPPGSRVLVPDLTFVASACAIERAGHHPVLADVDAETWSLTPEIARRAIREMSLSAVMPVCTYGNALDSNAWDAFSRETGLPVIVDAAGAFGNQLPGRHILAIFSLHATKALGIGEGAFAAAGDSEWIARVRRLSNFGIDTSTGYVQRSGSNAKMSEYHAAVALAALDRWPEYCGRRRRVHAQFREQLRRASLSLTLQRRPEDGVYTILCACLPQGVSAARVGARLLQEGVQTRRWYVPVLSDHPAFSGSARATSLGVVETLKERLLGLPFYPTLNEASIGQVVELLRRALEEQGFR
jgi:dTDP-4-amino-4,6-dideoxygalactose transaminase